MLFRGYLKRYNSTVSHSFINLQHYSFGIYIIQMAFAGRSPDASILETFTELVNCPNLNPL